MQYSTTGFTTVFCDGHRLYGCSVIGLTGDLQYDSVVKANIGECPVYYHHVCIKDFFSQLQQAEHRTSMKLYEWKCRKSEEKKRKHFYITVHFWNTSAAFIYLHHFKNQSQNGNAANIKLLVSV